MDIIVLIKKVPDPNLPEQFVSVSADGSAVQLHPVSQFSINLYDLNALECAVSLKEAHGGRVTVMTAGDASVDSFLRRAVSMGADRAVRVDLATQASPHATAESLSAAIRLFGMPDLILAGRQASDSDAGFVPHAVAQKLGLPSLSPVVAIGNVGEGKMVASKLSENTIDDYEVLLPAVLCVSNELNKPRKPSIKGVMQSKKMAIEVVAAPATEAAVAPETFALKSGGRAADTRTYSNCSDDEKAAALLAALGF